MNPDSPIELFFRLKDSQKKALKKLGLSTIKDILYHFPARYQNAGENKNIASLLKGDTAVIFGKISKLKTKKAFRKKIPMAEGWLSDDSGKIKIVWYNQAYLAKMLHDDAKVRVEGKVSERNGEMYLSNPKVEPFDNLPSAPQSFFKTDDLSIPLLPIYPESRGITSNWFYFANQKILSAGVLDKITEPIPTDILKKYNLPETKKALIWIHSPQKEDDAKTARKRFAFEEVFYIQLKAQSAKRKYKSEAGWKIEKKKEDLDGFINSFPFKHTGSQEKAIETILSDFKKGEPMTRLLEGDVGSGKTAVAATASFAVATSRPLKPVERDRFGRPLQSNGLAEKQDFGNLQIAYMAPTEILAKQHFESFIQFFKRYPLNIGLITGSGCRKFPSKVNPDGWTDISRAQLLKWVASGEIAVLIGTHALIQKTVKFKHLALAIIDEQHRFGTSQRQKLVQKDGYAPHLLSMTATPIPRTLALTIFGDLDLTLLTEMPAGRKPIITEILETSQRDTAYKKIREELQNGRQAYVICPRIDEPDPTKEMAVQAKSVKAEAKRLKESVFPEFEIDFIHSKMTPKAKDEVMDRFASGEIKILVSTSVVEVGVNVANATIMLIEGAERFGLAQLHQLRGRIIRSNHQAYCFALSESKGKTAYQRLKALKTAKNGFELAEYDLEQRGSGELYGRKQWGFSDIAMEAIRNIKMVEAARNEAHDMVEKDPELNKYPNLRQIMNTNKGNVHFE